MPPADYTNRYNTPIPPDRRNDFKQWKQQLPEHLQSIREYDLQGAYMGGAEPDPNSGHLTDQWKKPNHPTFSEHSQYSTPETPGGQWTQHPRVPDRWSFKPSEHNLKNLPVDEMRRYFQTHEPASVTLDMGEVE